jgi:biopolymer transport protein ExbD
MRRMKKPNEEAELNITSFMNLMIVLVPVLLLNMVFTQTMVLDIKLPAGAVSPDPTKKVEKFDISLQVFPDSFVVNVDTGKGPVALKKIDKEGEDYNYKELTTYLRALKGAGEEALNRGKKEDEEYKDKRDILISFTEDAEYQVTVKTIDAVRSYPEVVAASVVHAELLPDLSLGSLSKEAKAPEAAGGKK